VASTIAIVVAMVRTGTGRRGAVAGPTGRTGCDDDELLMPRVVTPYTISMPTSSEERSGGVPLSPD